MTLSPLLLLIEDDESDLLFLKRAFQKIGLQVPFRIVETGRKAVDYLGGAGPYADRGQFPLPTHILMDLKLPEKSGLAILEWIRSQSGLIALHVSILTSSSENRDLHHAQELGAECYLVKPMSFAVLVELARTIECWVLTGQIPAASRWPTQKTSPVRP